MKLFVPRISITNIPVVRAIIVAIFSLAADTNSAHGQLYDIEYNTGNFNGSNSLYSFNLNGGAHTLIGTFAPTIAGVGMSGLALVVPEPTSMTLAALAIVPLLVRRRRSQVKTLNLFGCRDRNVTSAVSAVGDVVRFQLSALIVATVQVMSFGVEQAAANSIPVGNAGFENPLLGDGGFTGSIPSWVVGDGVSDAGVFNPNAEYPGRIPEGQNVAFSKDPTISQVLGASLQANSLYTLQVDIGHRNNEPTLPGYAVELYAGGTLLASESSLAPGPGTFLTSVVSYFASPSDPLVGQALEIRLQVTPLLPYQVNFDNVRLDATVPGLTGDYDHNGIVDAADYVVWRKDSNRTTAQYDEWRSHFGQPPGSGAALPSAEPLSAAVPEPPTMVILLLGVVVMWCGRRSQNHKLISG
jgi:hypothetical protein